jgi:hypothetical protein
LTSAPWIPPQPTTHPIITKATMRFTTLLTLAGLSTVGAFITPSSSSRIQRHESPIAPAKPQHVLVTPSAHRSPITRLFMGWGPEPIWSTGFVDSTIQACPSGTCVSLKVQVEDGSGFVVPGQYVQVRPAGGEFRFTNYYQ